MSKTFYDVLDVSSDASEAAIRDAYREKVKEYHPDVCDHPDAVERFKRVKRAEEVLCDPDERAAYDRLGHDTYVGDGAGAAGTDGTTSSGDNTTVADVREAAARTAGRDHDAGGRGAGWRERERRASQRRAADWFGGGEDTGGRGGATRANTDGGATHAGTTDGGATDGGTAAADEDDWYGVGFDYENPGSRWTYSPPADEGVDAAADGEADAAADEGPDAASESEAADAAGSDGASTATGRAGVGGPTGSSRTGRGASDATRGGRGEYATATAGSRHAATEAWGHRDVREHTHAVHDWTSTERVSRVPRPGWTQDDVVLLVATLFLYPIFLLLAAVPAFHLSVNVLAGVGTLAYVAGLLPKPSMALPVFGTWSVGMPVLLLSFDVPVASAAFLVAVGGVWVPFLFAVAVASVLIR